MKPLGSLFRFQVAHLWVLLMAMAVFVLDWASKFWIQRALPIGDSIPLGSPQFQLTHLQNTGAAFSLFYDSPEALTWVSGLLLLGFFVFLLLQTDMTRLECFGFAGVLGGALGNWLERVLHGSVTDFIDVSIIHYPVFNLADTFIFLGMIGLLYTYVRHASHTTGS